MTFFCLTSSSYLDLVQINYPNTVSEVAVNLYFIPNCPINNSIIIVNYKQFDLMACIIDNCS